MKSESVFRFLGLKTSKKLEAAGLKTLDELCHLDPETLTALEGIGQARAEEILEAADAQRARLADQAARDASAESVASKQEAEDTPDDVLGAAPPGAEGTEVEPEHAPVSGAVLPDPHTPESAPLPPPEPVHSRDELEQATLRMMRSKGVDADRADAVARRVADLVQAEIAFAESVTPDDEAA